MRCNYCDGDNYVKDSDGKKVPANGDAPPIFIPCSCPSFNQERESFVEDGEEWDYDDRQTDPWQEVDGDGDGLWNQALDEDSEF